MPLSTIFPTNINKANNHLSPQNIEERPGLADGNPCGGFRHAHIMSRGETG